VGLRHQSEYQVYAYSLLRHPAYTEITYFLDRVLSNGSMNVPKDECIRGMFSLISHAVFSETEISSYLM